MWCEQPSAERPASYVGATASKPSVPRVPRHRVKHANIQAIPPLLIAIRVLEYRVITPDAFPPSTLSAITFKTPLSSMAQDGESIPPSYIRTPSPCLCRNSTTETVGERSTNASTVNLGKSHLHYPYHFDSMSRSSEILVDVNDWDFVEWFRGDEGWMQGDVI